MIKNKSMERKKPQMDCTQMNKKKESKKVLLSNDILIADGNTSSSPEKDRFFMFGEHIGNKLRILNNSRLQSIAEHRINIVLNEIETSTSKKSNSSRPNSNY